MVRSEINRFSEFSFFIPNGEIVKTDNTENDSHLAISNNIKNLMSIDSQIIN